MHTLPVIEKNAKKMANFSEDNRLISLALVGLGAILILVGPSLSGTADTLGVWCHHGVKFSATNLFHDLAQEFAWMTSQHCPYCYLGAALIGIGIATGLVPSASEGRPN